MTELEKLKSELKSFEERIEKLEKNEQEINWDELVREDKTYGIDCMAVNKEVGIPPRYMFNSEEEYTYLLVRRCIKRVYDKIRGDDVLDWNNQWQDKYSPCFDNKKKILVGINQNVIECESWLYQLSEEKAQKCIDICINLRGKNMLKYYFTGNW